MTTKHLSHIIKQVAAKTGYDKALVKQTLNAFCREVSTSLGGDVDKVRLEGFGYFHDTQRISQVCEGGDPRTGTKGAVVGWKKSHWVRFRPACLFRAYLNPHCKRSVMMARGDYNRMCRAKRQKLGLR